VKISCIHQGYELYGSDRTFVNCVDFLLDLYPGAAMDVILPKEGPLSREMRDRGYPVEVRDLWVLRKSYGVLGLLCRTVRLPAFVLRAWLRTRNSDLVYVNTGVIFDFSIAARLFANRTVIHVHEIPGKQVRPIFKALLGFSRASVIFNSEATKESLCLPANISSVVVYNGTDTPCEPSLPPPHNTLRILMIGRLNSWKGQDLLIESIALLPLEKRQWIEVRVLGDVFEGGPFLSRLRAQTKALGLTPNIEFKGFHADPSADYRWSDVVVVPSREPEPFGLVAIEAMSHGKPVIAAGHGGLIEIVEDGTSGWHFRPNDAAALATVIARAADHCGDLPRLGANARARFLHLFTREAFRVSFQQAINKLIPIKTN
jgi:glycosyltransferase involved in cell wall biosynthesis